MEDFFKIEKKDKILIIRFNDKEIQTLAMAGPSCYYEDPKYYKKYIYKYNLLNNPNIFSNSGDGHNMSLKKLMKYYKLAKQNKDILYEENILYKKLLKYKKKYKYVITQCDHDHTILEHEIKHSQYYFNKKYRTFVKMVWETLDEEIKEIIIDFLKDYNKKLYIDEFQAYITTEPSIFLSNEKKKKYIKREERIKKELNKISKLINNWLKTYG